MILGIGFDLVDPNRLATVLDTAGRSFKQHVFTPAEWAAAQDEPDRIAALAERFAAKEACLKALGTGWAEGLTLDQVSMTAAGRKGRHRIALTGAAADRARQLGVCDIHVSVASLAGLAAVTVVMTG